MGKIMEEKNKGTKKPKRNGTRPAKNSGKRIGKSRPEKADNAREGDPKVNNDWTGHPFSLSLGISLRDKK